METERAYFGQFIGLNEEDDQAFFDQLTRTFQVNFRLHGDMAIALQSVMVLYDLEHAEVSFADGVTKIQNVKRNQHLV